MKKTEAAYAVVDTHGEKIEHRLFCHITRNGRGVPLQTLEIMVNLIGSATTRTGLDVHAWLDANKYEKGRKITKADFAQISIKRKRRWRATKQAGLATIECFFHENDLSKSEVLEQQLIENLLREDLKPLEEARAFVSLMELNAWTGRQLATGSTRVNEDLVLI